jgi:hypothetical protein
MTALPSFDSEATNASRKRPPWSQPKAADHLAIFGQI